MVTFGKEKFLKFLSIAESFLLQNFATDTEKLERVIFGQFQVSSVFFSILEGLNEKIFELICT